MSTLVLSLILGLLWMAVGGSFTLADFLLGFALSAFSLRLVRREIGHDRIRVRPAAAVLLACLFAKELVLSALRVARTVLKRDMDLKPGIFAYPLALRRDGEIALLANLITLTPGTLSVDVSDDRQTLYVHALDCRDPEGARRDIRQGFEKRIREVFR